MLISILILAVFTVAAGIMLFTTPTDATAPPTEDPSINNPEDGIDRFPGIPPEESPTPSPTIAVTPPPAVVEVVQIHRTARAGGGRPVDVSFNLSRDTNWDVTSLVEPPGVDVTLSWSSSNEEVFTVEEVVGGARLTFVGEGTAHLILTAGEKEDTCIIRVNP